MRCKAAVIDGRRKMKDSKLSLCDSRKAQKLLVEALILHAFSPESGILNQPSRVRIRRLEDALWRDMPHS